MRVMLLVTDLERGGTPLRIASYARLLRGEHSGSGSNRAGSNAARGAAPVAARSAPPSNKPIAESTNQPILEPGVDSVVEPVVGCLGPPGPVGAALVREGFATFSCGAKGAWDGRALWRLAAAVRRFRPDLIHATLFHANVAARLVGAWRRVPVLTSTATIEVERRWHRWVERGTARWDRGHLVTSPALADHVHRSFGVARARIFVIPPALAAPPEPPSRSAARARLGLADQCFVIAWAGRMDPVKRVERLLVAAAQLTPGARPSVLLLAGDGPERAALGALAARVADRAQVRFLGWLDELADLHAAADVLVLPSLTEGLPNAVLEALLAGLPVVAAKLPGLRAIAEQCAGLLLSDAAEPAALAALLARLRDDPAECTRRAAAARAWGAAQVDPVNARMALLAAYSAALGRVKPEAIQSGH